MKREHFVCRVRVNKTTSAECFNCRVRAYNRTLPYEFIIIRVGETKRAIFVYKRDEAVTNPLKYALVSKIRRQNDVVVTGKRVRYSKRAVSFGYPWRAHVINDYRRDRLESFISHGRPRRFFEIIYFRETNIVRFADSVGPAGPADRARRRVRDYNFYLGRVQETLRVPVRQIRRP